MKPSFIVLLLVSPMLPANSLTRNSNWVATTRHLNLWTKSSMSRCHRLAAALQSLSPLIPNHYETQSLCYLS